MNGETLKWLTGLAKLFHLLFGCCQPVWEESGGQNGSRAPGACAACCGGEAVTEASSGLHLAALVPECWVGLALCPCTEGSWAGRLRGSLGATGNWGEGSVVGKTASPARHYELWVEVGAKRAGRGRPLLSARPAAQTPLSGAPGRPGARGVAARGQFGESRWAPRAHLPAPTCCCTRGRRGGARSWQGGGFPSKPGGNPRSPTAGRLCRRDSSALLGARSRALRLAAALPRACPRSSGRELLRGFGPRRRGRLAATRSRAPRQLRPLGRRRPVPKKGEFYGALRPPPIVVSAGNSRRSLAGPQSRKSGDAVDAAGLGVLRPDGEPSWGRRAGAERTGGVKMATGQAGAAVLLRSLFFFLGLLDHIVPSEGFQPNCTTDFATELVCGWSVDVATNCTREVRLLYAQENSQHRDEEAPLPSVCIPEYQQGSDLTQCTCSIPGKKFGGTSFFLALEVNGTRTGPMAKVDADNFVKPRPLVNLTADTNRRHSVVLTWAWDAVYTQESDLHIQAPTYQVNYWLEGQREKGYSDETQKQSYEIFVQRLSPGPYTAIVRFKSELFNSFWSEWSTPCKFHVESRDSSKDKLWPLVLWLCAVVMAVILASYLCFARLKRSWWDSIPNPAKSKVTEDMTWKPLSAARKTHMVGEGKTPLCDQRGRDYENFPGSFGATASPGPASRQQILQRGGYGTRPEAFLTPEVTLVESPLMICSPVSADKAEGPDREALADAAPLQEDAVASLFLKILDCKFSTVEEEPGSFSDQASHHLLSALGFLPETARKESLDSKRGYRSSLLEGAAPWGVSSALQQQHILSSSVLSLPKESLNAVLPLTTQQGEGSAAAVAQLSGYRCLGSLLSQPTAGPSQEWEPHLFPPEADQGQPWAGSSGHCSLESVFLQSSPWLSSCKVAAALNFQQAGPGAAYQNVPGKPGPISCLAEPLPSGYQSFSSAVHNGTAGTQQDHGCLGLSSPYKTFLSVFRDNPPEAPVGGVLSEPLPGHQEVGGEAWLGAVWGEDRAWRALSIGGQQGSGKAFFREEKGDGAKPRAF
ncbi:interleukin-4 receptor subunit alpha [Tiliqua scincoides]|uniref:interleukin-4 receptor subunit alpha n=1 Tax=Tiliqua scincoides TaxID=71010 RepID=UPI00346260AD